MRLIDAEALRDALYEADAITMRGVAIINQFPTIEAKPIVHAHWNADGRCTNCGGHAPFFAYADDWFETKYCPHCGAQMDEVASDNNVGSKTEGVKIPVISMEDVPKLMEEKE